MVETPVRSPLARATPQARATIASGAKSLLRFLKSRPILCLLLLTPGIPEYLSGSSPVNLIVLNPVLFFFQLGLNLALYGPGVLLVREAMIRWKKGWASVLFLGAAYGILEEGVALSTLFNPLAGPVGSLGSFGHAAGVNWVWVVGIVPVHMVFSIALPILLLGLALPETRGRSLLSRRGIFVAFLVLVVDVAVLAGIILTLEHFWMGWTTLGFSLLFIGALVLVAYAASPGLLRAFTPTPRISPLVAGLLGLASYPAVLLIQNLTIAIGWNPASVILAMIVTNGLLLFVVLRTLGSERNGPQLIAFSLGLILPLAVFGLVVGFQVPVILVVDVAMLLFFRKLWRMYPRVSETPVPVGALLPA